MGEAWCIHQPLVSHGTLDKYLNISYKCKLQILVSKVNVFSLTFDVKIKLIIFILAIKFKISRLDN